MELPASSIATAFILLAGNEGATPANTEGVPATDVPREAGDGSQPEDGGGKFKVSYTSYRQHSSYSSVTFCFLLQLQLLKKN